MQHLLNNPLIAPRTFPQHWQRRFLSFLNGFCKKRNEKSAGDEKEITIQLDNVFKLYNLETEPQSTVSLTKAQAKQLYANMQTIRKFENACANLYKEKAIRGFCHLYVGQEACCVGIQAAMRTQDTIITSYRSHGWTWLMGVSVHSLIAELCQKQTGCSRGKGGSMHTFAHRFFGGNGIVGAQVPIGTGLAFAHAYRCDDGVCFTCYGDGAANQGQIHEAFNIACLWKLPVVFVCENNKYGMGTSIQRSSCSTDYYTRGDYLPGLWVNGMDVLAVRSAAEFALKHACHCGPLVLEMETYRYHGHSMSDPGTSYRNREEIQMMRQKNDPIMGFRELCLNQCLMAEEEFKKIDAVIKQEVDEAVARAKSDKDTDIQELTTDVYAHNLETNIRGTVNRNLQHRNVGQSLIPLGKPKATAKSQIKELLKDETGRGSNTKGTDKDNGIDVGDPENDQVQKNAAAGGKLPTKDLKIVENPSTQSSVPPTDTTKNSK